MIQQSVDERLRFSAPAVEVQAKGTRGGKESGRKWSKTIINFWLDVGLLVVFVALLSVSTIVRFIFPAAANADGWTLWFGTLDQWMGIQFGVMALFAFLVLIHVMLHWPWVCGVISSRMARGNSEGIHKMDDGTRTIYGVGLMIVLLNIMGLGIALAALTIHGPF